ncbi:MAG: helix-turn-helix transcriptional regulator [Lachnospiraceae bacterium]|nr:helix-turn-helix transcriptional regulator [Lachnospiraceae bacterium]
MIISERIFKLMEAQGMSQKEFSQRTGIAQSSISDWKRKKTNPSSDKIMAICEALKVSPYDILGDDLDRQDTQGDYLIVNKGTDEYMLLMRYNDLSRRGRDRLIGYMQALSE